MTRTTKYRSFSLPNDPFGHSPSYTSAESVRNLLCEIEDWPEVQSAFNLLREIVNRHQTALVEGRDDAIVWEPLRKGRLLERARLMNKGRGRRDHLERRNPIASCGSERERQRVIDFRQRWFRPWRFGPQPKRFQAGHERRMRIGRPVTLSLREFFDEALDACETAQRVSLPSTRRAHALALLLYLLVMDDSPDFYVAMRKWRLPVMLWDLSVPDEFADDPEIKSILGDIAGEERRWRIFRQLDTRKWFRKDLRWLYPEEKNNEKTMIRLEADNDMPSSCPPWGAPLFDRANKWHWLTLSSAESSSAMRNELRARSKAAAARSSGEVDPAITTALFPECKIPMSSPDGYTKEELVTRAEISPSTFRNYREEAGIDASEPNGRGVSRRFYDPDVYELIIVARKKRGSTARLAAKSWSSLLSSEYRRRLQGACK